MNYRYIECEAFTTIIDKKDCAYHGKLGWSKTDWHTHNRGQLIYAENGIMRLYTEETVYYIPSFHAAWIPQGLVHRVLTESNELLFHTLYLEHSQLGGDFYQKTSVFPVSSLLREMILYTAKWHLDGEQNEHESSFLASIKHMLPEYAVHKIQLSVPVPADERLQRITRQIEEKLDSPLRAADLAAGSGMSERSMQRLFTKELGMSFSSYQKLMRMVKAAELLSVPGKTISEVAYSVGYDSLPSFTRSFREMMGASPSQLYQRG